MNTHKKQLALMILLTSLIALPASAQSQEGVFDLDAMLKFNGKLERQSMLASERKLERALDVMQDNDYVFTGMGGLYLSTSLMIDGIPLDFGQFNLTSMGVLSVTNNQVGGREIPFYVYLKRDGKKVVIQGHESMNETQTEVDLTEILKQAKAGDFLVIEPVKKGEGKVSTVKLLGLGC